MTVQFRVFVSALAFGLVAGAAQGAGTAQQFPYFASIKGDKAFMREGPSDEHRVKWIYHHKGLPVEVLSAFEVWRRVRDMDGETGWIHVALLSRDRTAVVVGTGDAPVHGHEDESSGVVAEAEPGAIGRLENCGKDACEVKFDAAEGWVDRSRLWGVDAAKPQ